MPTVVGQTITVPPVLPLAPPSDSVRVNRAILAGLEAIGAVIFPRVLLLLALSGAFVLSLYAMAWQSNIGLAILIAFSVLTIGPLSWLDRMARRG